nr:family 43 glycosylhydrolase [uncultured Flavobacterium sp.]
MKNNLIYIAFLLCFGCGNNDSQDTPTVPKTDEAKYFNPVVSSSMPDPTVILGKDGFFYLYATEDVRNVPILRSKNLVSWTKVGTAFTESTRPNFEPNGGIWAPDINLINDKYVLYYSMSVWGGEQTCGIGLAIADSPIGPFVDKGKLFRSNEIGVTNSIDPFYIEDNGIKYLVWGSFRGIYAIELASDGLTVKEGASKIQVAGTAFEGTYIIKKNNYYYLFASVGSCCEGLNSTYKTVVGRSSTLFGNYVNKAGKSMMDNEYEVVINKNSRFVGTGHNSEIIEDKEGKTWFLYHGVDVQNPNGRVLLLDEVKWDNDGWPFVQGGSASLNSKTPTF